MSGLVLELQAAALNRERSVSDLLRKALVVSKKLGVSEIEEWINNELKGYPPGSEVPEYRIVHGQIKVWNPYHGWQPLFFENHKMAEKLSSREIMQPIGELDSLNITEGVLHVPFPEHIKSSLMKAMELPLEPILHISRTEVIGILDTVQNIILEWALELEENGILGENISFSKEEKITANQVTYQITNYIGSMSNSQLQQASPHGNQKLDILNDLEPICSSLTHLKNRIHELELEAKKEKELSAEIETVLAQSQSPKPKKTIIRRSLESIRTILESAAGNVIANRIITEIGKFL